MTVHFRFDNSYARLPDRFFARLPPTPVTAPKLIKLNGQLASELGLDPEWLARPEGVQVLAGNRVPEGAEPTAMAYAGHQFGNFVPQLGDGRAILLGEVVGRDVLRRDIQLKGSGPTPFSRRGDGRAALGPVLREHAVSEAMAALGIPTTRTLAAVLTGEPVIRETLLPGAVLTRVAASHIRSSSSPCGAMWMVCAPWPITFWPGTTRKPFKPRSPTARSLRCGRPPRGSGRTLAPRRLHPWRYEHGQYVDRWRNFDPTSFDGWAERWRRRLADDGKDHGDT
jgi:hypothetical protein